jgi:hypothetical protein
MRSDGVYVDGSIQGIKVTLISAGPPLPFIRISKPNRASSSISATINSLSRVKLPRVMLKTASLLLIQEQREL